MLRGAILVGIPGRRLKHNIMLGPLMKAGCGHRKVKASDTALSTQRVVQEWFSDMAGKLLSICASSCLVLADCSEPAPWLGGDARSPDCQTSQTALSPPKKTSLMMASDSAMSHFLLGCLGYSQ